MQNISICVYNIKESVGDKMFPQLLDLLCSEIGHLH